jgi:hypothetical protein
MPNEALDAVIAAQKLSDSVYDLFSVQLGSTLEQAEIASRDPNIIKQFKMSAGGAVLKFQDKPAMRSDDGAPVKNFLKVNRLDFLLPPETLDPVKALAIPPDVLAAAQRGNLTAKSNLFTLLHGGKPKSEEAATVAKVNALIAGEALSEPVLDNQMVADDATRRANARRDAAHDNNPWANTAANCDAHGRYSAAAIGRQAALVKANLTGAAEIAAAVGSKIGDTTAKRRAAA